MYRLSTTVFMAPYLFTFEVPTPQRCVDRYDGTFYVIKYGELIMQASTYYCNVVTNVDWLRGHTVKCNYEFAIQLEQGKVVTMGSTINNFHLAPQVSITKDFGACQ